MTHTVAILEVSPATHADIKGRIEKIDASLGGGHYGHMFMPGGDIDMSFIAIRPDEPATPTLDATFAVLDALKAGDGGPNSHFVLGDEAEIEIVHAKRFVERLARAGYKVERA